MEVAVKKVSAWAGAVVAVAAAVGVGIAAYDKLPVPESVSVYHTSAVEEVLTPMQASLDNIETNAVVDRIMRIQEARCDNQNLQRIVQEQMARYHQLTGREFGLIPCAPEE